MIGWYQDDIIDHDRLALFLCFTAFIVTFVVTRVITRMIRAGRGPFHDHVTSGGLHVHHAVPGLILLIVGAFLSVGSGAEVPWAQIAGVLVGIGTSLVLDEFSMILHLSDVYWSQQGRISVEMVSLAIACLGFALVGFTPLSFIEGAGPGVTLTTVILLTATHVLVILVCVAKGRYVFALFGAFIPFLALFGAVRLGRPESLWARRSYGERRMAEARARAVVYDRRYGEFTSLVGGFVASPPDEDPGPAPAA